MRGFEKDSRKASRRLAVAHPGHNFRRQAINRRPKGAAMTRLRAP